MSLAFAAAFTSGSGWLMRLLDLFGGATLPALMQSASLVLLTTLMCTLTLLRFFPAQRQQAEVFAGGLAAFEVFNLALGLFGVGFTSPLLAVCTLGMFVLATDHLLYGRLLDAFGLWRPLSARHSFTVRATPHAGWNAVVPRPDTVSTHWIGALSAVTPTREPDVCVARYRLGDGTVLHKSLTTLAESHPEHVRYHFEPEADDDESRYGAGFYEAWFQAVDEETTEVTLLCEYTALRLRTALQLYFDDWLGSEADAIQAFVEQRPDTSMHARLWRDVLRQA
ncbi:MAG: hypothetical protein AAFN09_01420 [Pseudomonadota bacterium]